ncbi:WAS/WASL-interacting protein family member 1-like [Vombatus ursinus]|uniref:WAS/WASL-interacting protein family member 1-like n=1 Tax=Vombatus ursinus TaxID=29139 RepID=UPI000FFD3475|nr:WAS/WASL-interacting protein family member 1-like [Vombatus ursinus]
MMPARPRSLRTPRAGRPRLRRLQAPARASPPATEGLGSEEPRSRQRRGGGGGRSPLSRHLLGLLSRGEGFGTPGPSGPWAGAPHTGRPFPTFAATPPPPLLTHKHTHNQPRALSARSRRLSHARAPRPASGLRPPWWWVPGIRSVRPRPSVRPLASPLSTLPYPPPSPPPPPPQAGCVSQAGSRRKLPASLLVNQWRGRPPPPSSPPRLALPLPSPPRTESSPPAVGREKGKGGGKGKEGGWARLPGLSCPELGSFPPPPPAPRARRRLPGVAVVEVGWGAHGTPRGEGGRRGP